MEEAIDAIQDRIIFLTGQIELTKKEPMEEIVIKAVTKGWEDEIKKLKEAQSILYNHL